MNHQGLAELLGNYGEFVGAIAVVVTLAFLTYQIRQSTRSTQSTFQLHIQSEFTHASNFAMTSPDLCRLLAQCEGAATPDDLTPADREQLNYYVFSTLNTYAFAAMAYEGGQIDARTFDWYCQSFHALTIQRYPALLPLFRQNLVVPELQDNPMFRPLFNKA